MSLRDLENLLFMAENSQNPTAIITTLQKQQNPDFYLEELHWHALNARQQKLNIAVRRHETLTQKEQVSHVEKLFNKAPTVLPFDQYVDRFEVIVTQDLAQEKTK